MLNFSEGDFEIGSDLGAFPPVEFGGEVLVFKATGHAKAGEDLGLVSCDEFVEAGEVQVVVVIVADDDDVDLREFIEGDAGVVDSFGAGPSEWAYAFREDGIGEDVVATGLYQEGGVVDKGDADFFAFDFLCGRFVAGGFDPSGPFGVGGAYPHFQKVEEGVVLVFFGVLKCTVFKVRRLKASVHFVDSSAGDECCAKEES